MINDNLTNVNNFNSDIIKNNNNNKNEIDPNKINTLFDLVKNKKKLVYISSGSNGVVLKDIEKSDLIYKITTFSDTTEFYYPNYIETIYLNYFRINYPDQVNLEYFPIQNISTQITTYKIFKEDFEFDIEIQFKLKKINIEFDDDMIILNLMPYYHSSLFDLIYQTPVNDLLSDFENIAKKIIKSLNFIHKNSTLHGDIKCSNIMINKDICKIIDFGGIKLIGSKIYDKTCTLTSRSPEELLYEYSEVIISQPNLKKFFPNYGYKTDIWSLGIVLMELISGYNPLIKLYNKLKHTEKGNNQEEIEVNIENKICSVLNSKSHIQVNLDYLQKNNLQQMTEIKSKIERMLSIDPNIRYDNIDELYYDLFDEKLEILKKSEKTEPIYNINKDNLDIFNGFRKLNYNLVNEILFQTCDYNCLPLTISILDRYILKLLENSDENIINFLSESNKNLEIIDKIILFISASIISITLINRKTIIYEDILKTLNKFGLIDNKLMSSASINIKNLIMDITIVLDYNIIFDEYLFSDRTDPVNIKNIFVILYNKQY